jgi:uncharacterized protein with GYD domain
MFFIVLAKFKVKPTKKFIAESNKLFDKFAKDGGKVIGLYWTLGRYDSVGIIEAKNEKAIMKSLLRWFDSDSFETLVAVPRKEAVKLLEK